MYRFMRSSASKSTLAPQSSAMPNASEPKPSGVPCFLVDEDGVKRKGRQQDTYTGCSKQVSLLRLLGAVETGLTAAFPVATTSSQGLSPRSDPRLWTRKNVG